MLLLLRGVLMATITWFMTNTIVSVHQEMSETSPGAEATSSPNTGWTVAKVTPTVYSKLDSGTEQVSGTFAASPVEPDGSIDTTVGDCLRSTNVYNGTFAAGNWTFHGVVIAVSSGGDADGNVGWRLFRSPNADGSAAVEITSARQAGSVVTNLGTGASQDSTSSVNPGAVTLRAEYLFVQLGWEITGAGAATTRDVILRVGTTGTRLVTPDFTPETVTVDKWQRPAAEPVRGVAPAFQPAGAGPVFLEPVVEVLLDWFREPSLPDLRTRRLGWRPAWSGGGSDLAYPDFLFPFPQTNQPVRRAVETVDY